MSADAAAFLAERGLGAVERSTRLVGSLPVDGAGKLSVELCLGRTGAWLVAADGRFLGRAIDAADPAAIRYEQGRLRDRLVVIGAESVTIPAGKARAVRDLLALGRLRRDGFRAEHRALPNDRYVDAVDEALEWLVAALVRPPDTPIALLLVGDSETVRSALGAEIPRRTYWLLSAARSLRVSLSELGDHEIEDAAGRTLLTSRDGVTRVRLGETEWSLSTKRAALVSELVELDALEPSERLAEAARRLWLGRAPNEKAARAAALLRAAAERGHARAPFALALIEGTSHGPSALQAELERGVAAFRRGELPADAAAEIFERWAFPASLGRTVVTLLSAFGADAEPWALALHRAVHARAGDDDTARADLELAEHELASGAPDRARALAEARLARLNPEEDTVVAPDRVGPGLRTALRLNDVLCRESARRGRSDVPALAALARLEPSNVARWKALASAIATDARERHAIERAARVLAAIAPGGLDEPARVPTELPEALPRNRLDEHLRHPLARGGGRIATRLSELVATTPEPDLGFLRDFCEELSPDRHPDATRALARAVRWLGLPAIKTYVSHGARSVGMRAFGAREPFVLVGQSHLVERGPASLRGAELDFALGAELSHLAFGHQRVTVSEVWTGAAGKTRDALVALGVVLPLVGELAGARAHRLITRLTPDAFARAADGALKLDAWLGRERPAAPGLAQRNEELIAAHRLVQLSADRAGLISAQQLAPALRAMLVLRAEYRSVLHASGDLGLFEALAREPEGAAISDLRVRVRALIAFYLSADFEVLAPPNELFSAPPVETPLDASSR